MCDYEIQSDFDIKGLSLIDVSSEDDCLISSPLRDHINPQFSEKGNEIRTVRFAMSTDSIEISLGSFDEYGKLEEDETGENGRYNLRKSLTWDSSFFSSAAFLEPEEFSSMLGGNEKGDIHILPGILEDLNKSCDLSTMLDGETSTLESLKVNFVEDIRASIQKSNEVSDTASSSVKKELEIKDSRIVSSSKKLEYTNQDKVKQKAASKKPNTAVKDCGKTMKQVSARPQTSQSVARSQVSTSSLHKPPKGLSRVGPISTTQTKRTSLGAKDVKMEKDAKSVTGRGTTISKTPTLGDSRNIVPRPAPSSRSSSLICNSSLNMIKQNNDSSIVNSSSSGYTISNASKIPAEGKSQVGRSQLPTFLKSPTKLSSGMSAASSYGECSSESSLSSSASAANKRSNIVRASLGSGSCKGPITNCDAQLVLDSQSHHTRESSLGDGAEVTGSLDESENKVSDASTGLLHPASIKPSGLRPPSPKLAFSDGVKSSGHTQNRSMPFHPSAPIGLPNIGAKRTNPSGSSNKAPLRTLQRSATAATKVLSASRNPKISTGISPKLQNKSSPRTGRESYSKAQGIGSAEKIVGPDFPKLDVRLGGKDGARIKDTKIVPLAVPDY